MTKEKSFTTISELFDEYEEGKSRLSEEIIQRLSEPTDADFFEFCSSFSMLPAKKRQDILERLSNLMELDFLLDYHRIGEFALQDTDPSVRLEGINLLWFENTNLTLDILLNLLLNDPNEDVRASAASALGRFILASELGDFPKEKVAPLEKVLINIWNSGEEPISVKRRVLESLAYLSKDYIQSFIEDAISDNSREMRVSALHAMGRNGDEAKWQDYVIEYLNDAEDEEFRFEAIHASGELMLTDAIPFLIAGLNDSDKEIQIESISALGEIGGREAEEALHDLLENSDAEDLREVIEDALATIALTGGGFGFYSMLLDDDLS